MKIRRISLENFRNYKQSEAEVNSDLVLIVGENAAGKTNLLESIYYLANLKSFRAPDTMLPKFGEDYFKISALEENKLEIGVQFKPSMRRLLKLDDQKILKHNWRPFPVILFLPSDLNIFSSGPSLRRRFLNEAISPSDNVYSADLSSLEHILKQRGALIQTIARGQASVGQLEFWNTQLAEVGFRISKNRREFTAFLQARMEDLYKNLTGFSGNFEIRYSGLREETSFVDYLAEIENRVSAETRSGLNLTGPQRDDLIIYKDHEVNIHNSSRGELRSQILVLKLLQAEYLEAKLSVKPIILLDDVFSELDSKRQTMLLGKLKGHQIFITTTELPKLPEGLDVIVLQIVNDQITV